MTNTGLFSPGLVLLSSHTHNELRRRLSPRFFHTHTHPPTPTRTPHHGSPFTHRCTRARAHTHAPEHTHSHTRTHTHGASHGAGRQRVFGKDGLGLGPARRGLARCFLSSASLWRLEFPASMSPRMSSMRSWLSTYFFSHPRTERKCHEDPQPL